VIIGGIFVKSPHRPARLYVKVDNRRGRRDLIIQDGHLLGNVSIWNPPSRHNTWWRESSDREVLASVRAESNRIRHTEDEDMLDAWSCIEEIDTVDVTTSHAGSEPQAEAVEDSKPHAKKTAPVPPDPPVCYSVEIKQEDPTPTGSTTPELEDQKLAATNEQPQSPEESLMDFASLEERLLDITEDGEEQQDPSELSLDLSPVSSHIPGLIHPIATDRSLPSNIGLSEPTGSLVSQVATRNSEERPPASSNIKFELVYSVGGQRFSVKRTIEQAGTSTYKDGKKQSHLTVVRTLRAQFERRPPQVATTEMLPHILLQVGHMKPGQSLKTCPSIRALIDTGSGLNIGYEPYWRSVSVNHPEVVREFGKIGGNELTIGGIDKNGEGANCTHYIVLKTPFVDMGREVDLHIALTDSLSCNLILGIPFIVKAKMVIHTAEKYVVSGVFKMTFPIFYHPPELRDSVVVQTGTPLALAAGRKA
jgi:hypothetical protein